MLQPSPLRHPFILPLSVVPCTLAFLHSVSDSFFISGQACFGLILVKELGPPIIGFLGFFLPELA